MLALLPLLVFVLLPYVFAQQVSDCSLRLVLDDTYGDGFNGNNITLLSNGNVLTLTPITQLARVYPNGAATLTGGYTASFQFNVPAGSPVTIQYRYGSRNWPYENSWRIELFNAYPPFGAVVLTRSSLRNNIPTSSNIGRVVCGPRPSPITSMTVTRGTYIHQTKFDWPSISVSTSDASIVYTVAYRNIVDSNPNAWTLAVGSTTQSETNLILPPNTNLQLQFTVLNQYGPSTAFLYTYNSPDYPVGSLWIRLFDSTGNGWGQYDGFLFLTLDGIPMGSLTFPCASGSLCSSVTYQVMIPAGIRYTFGARFQAPSQGVTDCSFRIYNSSSFTSRNQLFYSGQNRQGPINPNAEIDVYFPGTPVSSDSGSQRPFNLQSGHESGGSNITCPASRPRVGSPCGGLTTTPCQFGGTCCCPNEARLQDRFCATDAFVCPGGSGAVWQVVVGTPDCDDPSFTCPSRCPSTAPSSRLGRSCSVAMTCNYPVSCSSPSNCSQTDVYTCSGSVSLTWSRSTTCSCTNLPTCPPWEVLVNSGDCCTRIPHCELDEQSTECLTPSAWSVCTPNNGNCGAGRQTRTVYTRTGTRCVTSTENRTCTVPCAVDCTGSWSSWSDCTTTCGIGYQTRTFRITTNASNGGNPCSETNGETQTRQCPNNPECGPLCQYAVDLFDSMSDGWGGRNGGSINITWPGQDEVITASVPANRNTFRQLINVPRGTTVTIRYTAGNDRSPTDASYAVALFIPPSTTLTDVVQSPPGLATDQRPEARRTFVSQCVVCTDATPTVCSNARRVACETAQEEDNRCGACLSGWESSSSSGTSTCSDVNECSASTNPCGIHRCTNSPGSFSCSCLDGWEMQNGVCVQTSSCGEFRVRKEFNDLTLAEKDRFVRAVRALGRGFWRRTRDAHAYVSQRDANDCHFDAWFLAWHRAFLKDVEDAFYDLPGDLECTTIPYWDWTRTSISSNPITYLRNNVFTSAREDGMWLGVGAKNSRTFASDSPPHPFSNLDGYRDSYDTSTRWTGYGPSQIYSLLTVRTYARLWPRLMNGAHNELHTYVGGYMAFLDLAAGDPVFFLHHGFIDALWAGWQACNDLTDPANPGVGWDSTDHSYTSPMPRSMNRVYRPRDVFSLDDLGIRYGTSLITRITATSLSYCPTANPAWFALTETASFVELKQSSPGSEQYASYYVPFSVVHDTTSPDVVVVRNNMTEPSDEYLNLNHVRGSARKSAARSEPESVTYRLRRHPISKVDPQLATSEDVAENYLASYEVYKTVLQETKDLDEANSARIDEECSQSTIPFPEGNMYPQYFIDQMQMNRVCAMGDCFHNCYKRTRGPYADRLKSKYQKDKERGKCKPRKEERMEHGTTERGTRPKPMKHKKRFADCAKNKLEILANMVVEGVST